MQSAHYLLKSRANSLTFQKNWEVGLKGRMIPASSIPLQSKDIALLERDWDVDSRILGLLCPLSKDIALLERDWDHWNTLNVKIRIFVERHRPARKGLRHACWIAIWLVFNRSKDIALFERDFVRIYFVKVKKTVKNLFIFDRTLFEEGINV